MISRFFKDFTWPFYEVYEEDWFTFYLIILLACLFQATILSVNYQIILLENNGKLLSTNLPINWRGERELAALGQTSSRNCLSFGNCTSFRVFFPSSRSVTKQASSGGSVGSCRVGRFCSNIRGWYRVPGDTVCRPRGGSRHPNKS